MKLIEKKVAAPELVWGNKYVTTSSDTYDMDIEKGTEVLLKSTEISDVGQVKIETKETFDYIKPEYLQPVTVVGTEVVPKLVVGQKYRITSAPYSDSFPKGTVVTFRSAELDDDGRIKIHSEDDFDWIEPQYLTPDTEEALTETTYTVELDEAEATAIRKALGEVTERAVSGSGELYTEFGQLLEGGK